MNKNIHEDLSQIRQIMESSARFFSLSGWAGILAGIYALIGAYFVYKIDYMSHARIYYDIYEGNYSAGALKLVLIAVLVFVFATGTAIYTSWRTAKKNGQKLWTPAARKMFYNMSLPLITGGIFGIILIFHGYIGLVAPITLIFYGISLLLAANYTYSNIRYLGLMEIALGLISAWYIGYGLLFWTIGFGVLHILYGIFMYLRYKK